MIRKFFILTVLLLTASPAFAFLTPTIDHCAYSDGGRWFGVNGAGCGTSFIQGSNVAFEFTLKKQLKIDSIEGWMSFNDLDFPYIDRNPGANLVVYKGSRYNEHTGTIPSLTKVFEERFFFEKLDIPGGGFTPADWHGVYDMDLKLKKGTYWVAFEDGVRGTFVSGANGLRFAEMHNPEPATMALFGAGLLGLWRRSRRQIKPV